ncbi:GbsR/MarR family transcriptional regulator [Streptomyces sp. NPDC059071]|uniref:GbsR/MarR family transcriptional regulator n=1 Tax=unclassified Streptomyces TaxID=2593676 RepID=UPI00364332DE
MTRNDEVGSGNDGGRSEGAGAGGGTGGGAGNDEAVARFVERFAGELTSAGMQRMASRVFAALLSSETASMTSAELAEQLQISPAAVSGAIRYLSQVDMVSRERDPGTRRDRYVLHNELWYETFTRRDQVLSRWEKILREGTDTLGPDTPAGRRTAETAEFFAFLHGEMAGIMDRWRAHKSAQGAETPGASGTSGTA